MTVALWPCGHARTPENTQRVGVAGERCRECRRRISRESERRSKARSSCRGKRGATEPDQQALDRLQSPHSAGVSASEQAAGHTLIAIPASQGACPESEAARIKSSMRPNCLNRDACMAAKPTTHCRRCSVIAVRTVDHLNRWRATPEGKAIQRARAIERLAKMNSPEALAARKEKVLRQRVGWCPKDRLQDYEVLRRKVGAKEARRLMEIELGRGQEILEARAAIADFDRAQRERHARQLAEAY